MKTIISLVAIFCCTLVFAEIPPVAKTNETVSETLTATSTSFSFIRGHKQGKNHTVTWGMNNNSGITHFIVESTYEDPNDPYSVWRTVGMLPCTPRMPIFKMVDSPYLPGTLNYRVIAVMDDNSTITSDFYTIYIQ